MTKNGAHESERYGSQNQQRLPVRSEGDRHQGIDHHHGECHQPHGGLAKFDFFLQFPIEVHKQVGVLLLPLRQIIAEHRLHNRARRRAVRFNVCLHFQRTQAIESLQFLIPGFNPIGGYGLKRHLTATGRTDIHIIQVSDSEPLYLWITHHDLDVFSPSRNTLRFRTVKRLPHLSRHIRQTNAQCFRRRL